MLFIINSLIKKRYIIRKIFKNFFSNTYIYTSMSNDNKSSRSIDDEVKKLFQTNNGKISNKDFIALRQKYNDVDIVEKIQQLYLEKYQHINKKAKKFARLIKEKFNNNEYPYHHFLEKAKIYKQKHNLSDEEFAEFKRIYEQELMGMKSSEVILPFTNMSKLLGNVNVEIRSQTTFSDSDLKHLQEILKLYASTRQLHASVQMQSFRYKDLDTIAMSGEFKKEFGHNVEDHVHPVIAALFLPKFESSSIETSFLQSNLAAVIKVRINSQAFITRADYELFYALTMDPNDIVCDSSSPMLDLLNRVQLQHALWHNVLNLRNGIYFKPEFRQFMGAIDTCKRNRYDNPDILYGQSEGIVLKRLLASFSYRPIYIATTPNIVGESMTNPFIQNIRPLVTNIPMYNLRLPSEMPENEAPINIFSTFNQDQYFIENNKFISKTTKFLGSDGVVIIFVDRTTLQPLNWKKDKNPLSFDKLPKSIGARIKLNTTPINVVPQDTINNVDLTLRSVVVSNYDTSLKIFLGCSALLLETNTNSDTCYYYDPLGAVREEPPVGSGVLAQPCRTIAMNDITNNNEDNFDNLASTKGTIFIYECKDTTV